MQKTYHKYSDTCQKLCTDAVLNKKLMKKLKESRFDVVIRDAIYPCAELLVKLPTLPLVYSLQLTTGNTHKKLCGGLIVPPSYIPIIIFELSDKMTFMEKVTNMVY